MGIRVNVNFLNLALAACLVFSSYATVEAMEQNIASEAVVTASSYLKDSKPENAVDGVSRVLDKNEWASNAVMPYWQSLDFPWIRLDWENERKICKVILYDRPTLDSHTAGGVLSFSDGSKISVLNIPDDGSPKVISFPEKTVKWMRFDPTDAVGSYVGLSEIEVFQSLSENKDYVSWVNPFIETTKGRFFFFVTGSRPFGMISAAPMTRNRNQYGGGYNYNSTEILGFPQIHDWEIAGLTFMPVTGDVDFRKGENNWKSSFYHEDEVAMPGYHKVFLNKYKLKVEQTVTQRVSMYKITAAERSDLRLMFNLGGFIASTTMVNANVQKLGDDSVEGSFDTYGRLWGGPENVKVYFAIKFKEPFNSLDGWAEDTTYSDISNFRGSSKISRRVPNSGLNYLDSPSSGIYASYKAEAGNEYLVKISISFVSCENAWENMNSECAGWDFDDVKRDAISEWNEWLGKIDVKGGTENQRVKFYTDLWHVLLGRHRLNDVNGEYMDLTQGRRYYSYIVDLKPQVRRVTLDENGKPKFNMYNSDAFWLTNWNLNILWGLAYPEILDDVAASLIQYADNGKYIPRGPCAGGYSFIMTGCPATPLIVCAYNKGILTKTDPERAYQHMKWNHGLDGMISIDQNYLDKGYIIGNAGRTLEANFQDWSLAQMAGKLGHEEDKQYYLKRAEGWKSLYNPDQGLIFPKDEKGEWTTDNPLDGRGWVEANSWQATWLVSHDLRELADTMGGDDAFCEKLNHAFEMSASQDFIYGYSSGYVSYANQPGCSNAHVFSWGGKPWLTQYWVRRVQEQAYGKVSPDYGYGGHDEDQGQMGAVSALMSIGLFSVRGTASENPVYEITSPIFDEITIQLNDKYYSGKTFRIVTHDNSHSNCYIQKARLNGKRLDTFWFYHEDFAKGGLLEIWLGDRPNKKWGTGGYPE
jgi:predicted alpha-1,2-mannosidase